MKKTVILRTGGTKASKRNTETSLLTSGMLRGATPVFFCVTTEIFSSTTKRNRNVNTLSL